MSSPFSSSLDRRKSFLPSDVVDDLEHASVQPGILDSEFLREPAPVHEEVAGVFAAALLPERDFRIGDKVAHDIRQHAEASRNSARLVEMMSRRIRQQD